MSKNIGNKAAAQDNFIGPNAPTGLTATNVGANRAFNDGRIDLAWVAPTGANTPTSYKIMRGGAEIATVSHPTVTYSNTGLTSATLYSYTVRAADAYGTSADSNAATATATTVPSAPTSASATAGVNANTVQWAAPATGGTAITNYYVVGNDATTGNTTGLSVSIADSANTSQYYNVYADNANGRSAASNNTNTVTTLAPTFFAPPFFPPFFPPSFFAPPGFFAPPSFFAPPVFFAPPGFFAPPVFFAPPSFFAPPTFGSRFIRSY